MLINPTSTAPVSSCKSPSVRVRPRAKVKERMCGNVGQPGRPQEDRRGGRLRRSLAPAPSLSLILCLSPTNLLAVQPLKDGTQNIPALRWQQLIDMVAHLKV